MPEIASVLDAMTVFPDRARVTRRGRVALEPGGHRLEIPGLPMSLLPDSVRAAGRGTARARLLGVSLRLEHFLDTPAEAARELETKIQAALDADADLAAQAGLLEKAQQALDGLAAQNDVFTRGLALRGRSTADQGAIYDFIAELGARPGAAIRYKYRIEVENLRDAPQAVFVRDQLPVSRHEQVKVKLEAAEPRWPPTTTSSPSR